MTSKEQVHLTHSRDDIWHRVNEQSSQISEIGKGQAATDARLVALESAVDSGFQSISRELSSISMKVNAPSAPPNYVAWLAALLGAVGSFGGYSLLITSPIKEDVHLLQQAQLENIRYQRETAQALGALEERSKHKINED